MRRRRSDRPQLDYSRTAGENNADAMELGDGPFRGTLAGMAMILRGIRIAWLIVCVVTCCLITYSWVRSYSVGESYAFRDGHRYLIRCGWLYIDETFSLPSLRHMPSVQESLDQHFSGERREFLILGDPRNVRVDGKGKAVPYVVLFLIVATLGGAPWIFRRYSLRTLLVAMTLVAVVFGWGVWLLD